MTLIYCAVTNCSCHNSGYSCRQTPIVKSFGYEFRLDICACAPDDTVIPVNGQYELESWLELNTSQPAHISIVVIRDFMYLTLIYEPGQIYTKHQQLVCHLIGFQPRCLPFIQYWARRALLKSNRIIAGEKWASYYMPVWHKQSSRNNIPMSLHWSKIPFSCLSYITELFPRTDCSSRMTINGCW